MINPMNVNEEDDDVTQPMKRSDLPGFNPRVRIVGLPAAKVPDDTSAASQDVAVERVTEPAVTEPAVAEPAVAEPAVAEPAVAESPDSDPEKGASAVSVRAIMDVGSPKSSSPTPPPALDDHQVESSDDEAPLTQPPASVDPPTTRKPQPSSPPESDDYAEDFDDESGVRLADKKSSDGGVITSAPELELSHLEWEEREHRTDRIIVPEATASEAESVPDTESVPDAESAPDTAKSDASTKVTVTAAEPLGSLAWDDDEVTMPKHTAALRAQALTLATVNAARRLTASMGKGKGPNDTLADDSPASEPVPNQRAKGKGHTLVDESADLDDRDSEPVRDQGLERKIRSRGDDTLVDLSPQSAVTGPLGPDSVSDDRLEAASRIDSNATKIGVPQVGVSPVGATKVGATKVGATKVGNVTEVSAEHGPPDSRDLRRPPAFSSAPPMSAVGPRNAPSSVPQARATMPSTPPPAKETMPSNPVVGGDAPSSVEVDLVDVDSDDELRALLTDEDAFADTPPPRALRTPSNAPAAIAALPERTGAPEVLAPLHGENQSVPPEHLSFPPVATVDSPPSFTEPPRRNRGGFFAVAAVLLMCLVVVAVAFIPKTGSLAVRLDRPDGVSAAKAEIFVDGRKRCDTDPCILRDLEPGRHVVKVVIGGASSQATVEVKADERARVTIPFPAVKAESGKKKGENRDAETAAVTGLSIDVRTSAVRVVLVHGRSTRVLKGPWPKVIELKPGAYKVVASRHGFTAFVQKVTLVEGKGVQPVRIELIKAQARPASPKPLPKAPPRRPTPAPAPSDSDSDDIYD